MKILIIDDHALIRQAMHGVLRKLKRDSMVLDAGSYQEATKVLADNPDIGLILLDLTLPDRDGFSVLEEIRDHHPAMSIVVLSAVQDSANVSRALNMGASGYIPKSARGDVIVGALRLIMSGGVYVPPEILARENSSMSAETDVEAVLEKLTAAGIAITDRQVEVLALIMQGKNNKTICRSLDLAEPTVKNHVTAILKAPKATNRTEAVIAVNKLGLRLPKLAPTVTD